jgi:hypothetical protein
MEIYLMSGRINQVHGHADLWMVLCAPSSERVIDTLGHLFIAGAYER